MQSKRPLFKFYRSYFEVGEELPDKERLAFYDALFNKQFFGIEPDLKGLSKFAYISQKHSIDAQIKGWEDKTGETLKLPIDEGTQGGTQGGSVQIQIQSEIKEEKQYTIDWDVLLNFFNKVTGKKSRVIPEKVKTQFIARLKEKYTKEDIKNAIINVCKDSFHIETNLKYVTLEFISRADKLDKFCQIVDQNNTGKTNQKLMTYDD